MPLPPYADEFNQPPIPSHDTVPSKNCQGDNDQPQQEHDDGRQGNASIRHMAAKYKKDELGK